ncbi:MAG: hypothetical protein B7Z40_08710 [Bosea sp. 12-68-7]|nr:MAG: hypothetical protein B7Z40_08710 [Bosea sp. 12-68-7]
MTEDFPDAEDYPDPGEGYREPESIAWYGLTDGLAALHLFGSDAFLRMQSNNLALVDQFIMDLETELLATYFREERTPMDQAMFLSAQSQMWIFAAYELMRTWRQRAKDVLKLHANGGLKLKAESLEKDQGYVHHGREARARELREMMADPALVLRLEEDLRHTHICFTRMEFIRVALAKHEVSGKPKAVAYAPGYGRINMDCGALEYQMSNGPMILGNISRRDIADEIRALSDRSRIPTPEDLKEFDASMNPPANPFGN